MHWLTFVGTFVILGLIVINKRVKQLPSWASFLCYLAGALMIIGGMVLHRLANPD